jgi:DNA repair protein RadC
MQNGFGIAGAAARAALAQTRERRVRDMPRERPLEAGASALSDTELIALFLGCGLPGHNVFELAHSLLARFGSLRAMLDATPADFKGLRGIGPAKTAVLLAVVEIARRALAEKARERPLIDSSAAVEDYVRLLIGTRPYEVFPEAGRSGRRNAIERPSYNGRRAATESANTV